jgi:hypothetical protein
VTDKNWPHNEQVATGRPNGVNDVFDQMHTYYTAAGAITCSATVLTDALAFSAASSRCQMECYSIHCVRVCREYAGTVFGIYWQLCTSKEE